MSRRCGEEGGLGGGHRGGEGRIGSGHDEEGIRWWGGGRWWVDGGAALALCRVNA